MKYQIVLPVTPNGSVSFDLDEIAVDFSWRTLRNGSMICDITTNNGEVEYKLGGRACVNLSPLLWESPWKSGKGNLYFMDKTGNDDPRYSEFNDRFILVYDDAYVFEGQGDAGD